MKNVAVVVAVTVVVAVVVSHGGAAPQACKSGDAQGFAAIRQSPQELVGQIPSEFTRDQKFFMRRYNCTGGHVYARRVDLGVYEFKFPGLPWRAPVVSALSQEGVTASVYVFGDVYRVALRGPLSGEDVAIRRDVPFSVAIH